MRTNLLLLTVFLSFIVYANIGQMDGYIGVTKLDGGDGCGCHWFEASDSVFVWIEGPDTVYASDTAYFTLKLAGGPAVVGGFNIAALSGAVDSTDSLTYKKLNTFTSREELTHSFPNSFSNDTVSWNFKYIAPDMTTTDTIYATGNSCNGDSIPTNLDQWNHAENFAVNVIEEPVYMADENVVINSFILFQNYPNPFNPSTKISWQSPAESRHTLKIFDVLGNHIATLVDEYKPAGNYEVEFKSAKGSLQLKSGIYFYQLKTEDFIQTKKMLLLK